MIILERKQDGLKMNLYTAKVKISTVISTIGTMMISDRHRGRKAHYHEPLTTKGKS